MLHTIQQVAELLGVPVNTARQRAKRLRLAGRKLGVKRGIQWFYSARHVELLRAAGRNDE